MGPGRSCPAMAKADTRLHHDPLASGAAFRDGIPCAVTGSRERSRALALHGVGESRGKRPAPLQRSVGTEVASGNSPEDVS
jgi:hypothetical protein